MGFVTDQYPPNAAATVVLPFQCNLKNKKNLYTILSTLKSQRFLLLFSFLSVYGCKLMRLHETEANDNC